MRIAICDDEEAQRALIIKYLQEWATLRGHNVETFAVVVQDFCMFAFPLGENIAGADEFERDELVEAL